MKKNDIAYDINGLIKELRECNCYCFGAGRQLTEICSDIPELIECIDAVIDNNPALHYSQRDICGKKVTIYPAKYLVDNNSKNNILLITSSYKKEILEGLEKIPELSELRYTDFQEVLDAAAWNCDKPKPNFKKNLNPVIPKVVHYCWFGKGKKPERLQKYINGWKELLPDYEIIEWNESNYDYKKNKYMSKAYDCKKWGFVSDFARLDVVHSNGGIYLDTDVELIRRPDELLYNDAYIGFERLSSVNTGAGFGAVKGFSILKELMDYYMDRDFKNEEDPNKMILCPIYETELLFKHGLKLNGNFQIVDNISVYPVEYFNAKSLYSNRLKITDSTISVHHCTWTWAGEKNKL
ncbi:MAG: hypothetical protein K5662_07630 [Lachnospiraceae bacterium]|nr:hypothetical protein [Lachnospiraceae bacterium]